MLGQNDSEPWHTVAQKTQSLFQDVSIFLWALSCNTSSRRHSGDILVSCLNFLSCLLSVWRSRGSSLSLSWMIKLLNTFLRESQDTLKRKFISVCMSNLIHYKARTKNSMHSSKRQQTTWDNDRNLQKLNHPRKTQTCHLLMKTLVRQWNTQWDLIYSRYT